MATRTLGRVDVTVRLYAELNDFVRRPDPRGRYDAPAPSPRSAKDVVESLGVPHTEIDLILRGGESIELETLVGAGDRLAVYPMFEAVDIGDLQQVRPEPLREPRFVLDVHLGTLARNLRLLGFDSDYTPERDDPELARVSVRERRILLTRDRGLLKRGEITHGACVRAHDPFEQTVDVLRRFDLAGRIAPFTRCLICNGELGVVDKSAVLDRLPPRTRRDHHRFVACGRCGQVFWAGSHHGRLTKLVDDVRRALRDTSGT